MIDLKEIPTTKNGQEISWKSVLKDSNLDSMFTQESYVSQNRLFYSINGTMANKNMYSGVNKKMLYKKLCSEYHLSKDKIIKVKHFSLLDNDSGYNSINGTLWGTRLLLIKPDLFVCLESFCSGAEILYGSNVDDDSLNKLIELIESCPLIEDEKDKIHLVCTDKDGLKLEIGRAHV